MGEVMKAWGMGEEKVVAKKFSIALQRRVGRGARKGCCPPLAFGRARGWSLLKRASLKSVEEVRLVADLHPMGPGAVIVASVGSGRQLNHTGVDPPKQRLLRRGGVVEQGEAEGLCQAQVENHVGVIAGGGALGAV